MKNKSNWRLIACAFSFLATLVCTVILAALSPGKQSPTGILLLGIFPLHIAGLATAFYFVYTHTHPGKRLTTLKLSTRQMKKGCFSRTLKVYPLIYLAVLGVQISVMLLLKLFDITPDASPILDLLNENTPAVTWLAAFFAVSIAAPIAEEILFRSLLYDGLKLRIGPSAALPATCFIFAAFHMIPEQIPSLFVLSYFLQQQRKNEGTLYAPILTHALFNTTALLLLRLSLNQSN